MGKVDSTIESWQALTRKLVSLRDQADAELAAKLQQPQVRAALADYFQSGSHYCHALGVIHWTILTGECKTSKMASYQQRVLRGEQEWLESMQRLPFPVVEQMRRITAMRDPEFSEAQYTLTKTLSADASLPIVTALTGAISQLIEGYTRLHTDKLVNLASDTLGKAADDIVHLTGVAMQALQMPLARAVPLGQIAPLKPGEYRFQPDSFSRSIKAISARRVFQILPDGKSVSAYLESLSGSPHFQRYVVRVLAPLHIINASLAINDALKNKNFESDVAAFSATMSALSFFGGEAEKWAKKNLEVVRIKDEEAERLIKKSRKILAHPSRHSARSQARALRRIEANSLLGESLEEKGRALGIKKFAGKAAKQVFGAAGGLAEVVFGGWNVTKGLATGNMEVAAGGSLGMVGGALIIWGTLASSSVVAAPLGAVLALAGGLMAMLGERSKLENALRLGYFGQDAYPVIGGPFEEPEARVRLGPASGLVETIRPLPDLSDEINYFRRLFCQVKAHVGIHRESKPSLLPMDGTPAPTSDHVIVKTRVDMSGYQIGQSKLNLALTLFHEPGWMPGESGKRYHCSALYTKEVLDGGALVALEGYLRLPKEAVSHGFGYAEVEASLDLVGDDSLIAPLEGPASHWSWQWEGTSISDHTWQHIEKTATPPSAKPERID